MNVVSVFLVAIVTFAASASANAQAEEEEVLISPKCAAVLLSGGWLGGAGLAYAAAPTVLCTAGFCPVGVSGGSFASWWQSTMPLVASGSLFSMLQSVAMGGVGMKVALTGGVLGSTLSRKYLPEVCAYVDASDSPVFSGALVAVREANLAAEKAKATCSSSELCASTVDLAKEASATVSSSLSSMWNYFSEGASQTAEAYNEAVIRMLEKKIEMLEEEIEDLRKKTPTVDVIESIHTKQERLDHSRARLFRKQEARQDEL